MPGTAEIGDDTVQSSFVDVERPAFWQGIYARLRGREAPQPRVTTGPIKTKRYS